MRLLVLSCALLLAPLHARRSRADEGPARPESAGNEAAREPPRAAIVHYQKGRELYLAGRYREAVVELEQALTLDPDSPNLRYNLARVYELLGEIDTSIVHYKRYRDLLPPADVEERARVDGTLQRLEGARTQVSDDEPLAQWPASRPPERERGVADATFWTFTALSAAALATGAALGVMALNAEKDVKSFVLEGDDGIVERKEKERRADRLALGSDISLLAGAVLGTTAILLFALRDKPAKAASRAALDLSAGPKGAFFVLRVRL